MISTILERSIDTIGYQMLFPNTETHSRVYALSNKTGGFNLYEVLTSWNFRCTFSPVTEIGTAETEKAAHKFLKKYLMSGLTRWSVDDRTKKRNRRKFQKTPAA